MKTVSKGRLKAKMLAYFREVEASGESLIVTDHGREVLEVRPILPKSVSTAEVLNAYRSGRHHGISIPDEEVLIAPVDLDEWEALQRDL